MQNDIHFFFIKVGKKYTEFGLLYCDEHRHAMMDVEKGFHGLKIANETHIFGFSQNFRKHKNMLRTWKFVGEDHIVLVIIPYFFLT